MHFSYLLHFFFIFLNIPFLPSSSELNPASSPYKDCAPQPYTCDDKTFNISYPFQIDSRPSYCGLPEYLIKCTNMNTLAITISDQQYKITNIDYDNNLVNIVNEDFLLDTSCPRTFTSTTIDTKLFQYQRDRNLTLYINCSVPLIFQPIANYVCLDFGGQSYFSLDNGNWDDFAVKCNSIINMPLGQETANNLVDGRLQLKQALRQGFSLQWTAGSDWCRTCLNSGGYCGFNSTVPTQHLCFCSNGTSIDSCDSQDDGTHTAKKIVIGVACGFGGFFLACAGSFYIYRCKLKKHKDTAMIPKQSVYSKYSSDKDTESISFNCNTPLFSYEELVEATNGFEASRELGDGGFGTVYKGILKDGRVVAIKRLYETSYKRVEQFMNEVEILSRLRHPNLVTLYGSTSPNSPHLLLVYEFIPNGTIADHLHNPTRSKSLSLCLRLKMAIDTAASLSYLHSIDIIHRDVKSNNILVDNNFNIKVADFGLSRLFPPNRTHVSTAPQGTPGYLDPEYHRFYQLTDKSDVYSFGVVLMELISSRPAVDIDRKPNEISLAMSAISKIQKGELSDLIDPFLRFNSNQEANRIITQIAGLAFRCLQMDREMRPSIKEVLKELKEIEEGAHFAYEDDCYKKKMGEEATLLGKSEPESPESVSCTWTSRSTTPSTSS